MALALGLGVVPWACAVLEVFGGVADGLAVAWPPPQPAARLASKVSVASHRRERAKRGGVEVLGREGRWMPTVLPKTQVMRSAVYPDHPRSC